MWIPYIFLLSSLLLTFILAFLAENYYSNQKKELFKVKVEDAVNRIEARMHNYEYALNAGLAFLNASDNVTERDWQNFVNILKTNRFYPGIQGLGYTLMLQPEEVAALEKKMSHEEKFSVYPKGEREMYSAIIYLEPKDNRNKIAIGYDMYSEPKRHQAMDVARDTNQITITAPVTLVQEIDNDIQPGILMYAPLYKKEMELNTPQKRREALIGYVYSPFRINDLMQEILMPINSLNFKILDITDNLEGDFIYQSITSPKEESHRHYTQSKLLQIAGRSWKIHFTCGHTLNLDTQSKEPLIFLIIGIIFNFLIFALLLYLVKSRKNLHDASLALRSSQLLLRTIVDEMPDVFVLKDENGNFLICNQTVAKLYNTTPEAMIGKNDGDFGVPPELNELFRQNVLSIMKSGKAEIVYEDSRDSITGDVHHFRSIKKPLKDAEGKNQILVIAQDVTEIIRANKKVVENEQRLKEVLEITREGIWDWNVLTGEVKHNAQWYTILGFEENEMVDSVTAFVNQIHPEDRLLVQSRIQKILEGLNRIYYSEHRMICKNGDIIWVHDRGKVVEYDKTNHAPLRIIGSFTNITERKKAENKLLRLSQVVDQNPYPTIITNTDGIIEYVNPACANLTGYSNNEIIGKKISIFSSGVHTKEFYKELWDTIKKNKSIWKGMLTNEMKNKELKDLESTIFPLFDHENKLVNFVSIEEDITQRNVKDKLFMIQTRQAQMGEMLSMIAHQWRQPLAVINAISGKLRLKEALKDEEDEILIENLIEIQNQSLHLSNTITDFRDFFRPDKPKERIRISAILKNALNLVDHSLKNHKITFTHDIYKDPMVDTFANELLQVLIALIKNSIDAFEENQISEPFIKISIDQQDDYATISFLDNAGGIKTDLLKKIFLPYFTTKKLSHGTGLGLYMSKMIIEEHCMGKIEVLSDSIATTNFIISLPLEENNV